MSENGQFDRRRFIELAGITAAGMILPRNLRGDPPQNPIVNTVVEKGRPVDREAVSWKVLPFPNKSVRLLYGIFKEQTNINHNSGQIRNLHWL